MDRGYSVLCRRSCLILVPALLAIPACGRNKDEGRSEKLTASATAADAALVDTVAGQSRIFAGAQPSELPPAWTQELPHFFNRDGRRFASAVGWARTGDLALARATAEDRARVALVILIQGGASVDAVKGALPGARMTDSFTSKDGFVFVRLEVQAEPQ